MPERDAAAVRVDVTGSKRSPRFVSARNWSTTEANASFTSMTSMSSQVSPAFASARSQACGLPCSIRCGSTPARPKPRKRARGSSPSAEAFSSEATSTAAEPSTIWLELPAVIFPSGTKAGWSAAIVSSVVSRRTASSTAKRVRDERRAGVRRRKVELDRDDLVLEAALVDRARGAHVRLVRVLVDLLAREVPLRGDLLGRDALRDDVEALEHRVGHRPAVRAHRDARHHLDAARDTRSSWPDQTAAAALKFGLHRRAALPVDRRPADGDRPAGGQRDVPADVPGLLPDLGDAAPLEVLDLARVDAVPLDEAVQHLGGNVVAANMRERPVLLPDRAPNGVDDQRICLSRGHAHYCICARCCRKNAKMELIARVPLFGGCSKRELGEIASLADELSLPAGRKLAAEGGVGRSSS